MNNVFPDRDAVPQQNPNYPMAALKSSAYAAPLMYNRPSEALGGYDAQVNPMTGEEMGQTNFARGGLASLTQPSDDFTRAMHAGIAAYAGGGSVRHFKTGDKVTSQDMTMYTGSMIPGLRPIGASNIEGANSPHAMTGGGLSPEQIEMLGSYASSAVGANKDLPANELQKALAERGVNVSLSDVNKAMASAGYKSYGTVTPGLVTLGSGQAISTPSNAGQTSLRDLAGNVLGGIAQGTQNIVAGGLGSQLIGPIGGTAAANYSSKQTGFADWVRNLVSGSGKGSSSSSSGGGGGGGDAVYGYDERTLDPNELETIDITGDWGNAVDPNQFRDLLDNLKIYDFSGVDKGTGGVPVDSADDLDEVVVQSKKIDDKPVVKPVTTTTPIEKTETVKDPELDEIVVQSKKIDDKPVVKPVTTTPIIEKNIVDPGYTGAGWQPTIKTDDKAKTSNPGIITTTTAGGVQDQPSDVGVPKEGAGTGAGAWTGIPLAGAFRSAYDPMYSASTSAQYGGSDAQNLQDYMANLNQSLRPGPITPYTFQTAPARTATPQGIASVAPSQGQTMATTTAPSQGVASFTTAPQTTAQPQGIASAAPTQFQPQTAAPTVQPQGVASVAPAPTPAPVQPQGIASGSSTPLGGILAPPTPVQAPPDDTGARLSMTTAGFNTPEELDKYLADQRAQMEANNAAQAERTRLYNEQVLANMTPEERADFDQKQAAIQAEFANRREWAPSMGGGDRMMPDNFGGEERNYQYQIPRMGDGAYPDMPDEMPRIGDGSYPDLPSMGRDPFPGYYQPDEGGGLRPPPIQALPMPYPDMPREIPSMGDGSYPDLPSIGRGYESGPYDPGMRDSDLEQMPRVVGGDFNPFSEMAGKAALAQNPVMDESYYGGRKQFGNEPNIDEAFAHGGIAHGGIGSLPGTYKAGGKLLRGPGDGMSDSIPAVIHGKKTQRAALADGEFVIPADVVSHLGNGSTDAGARKLYAMMDKIRQARTGRTRQAPQVSVDRYMPKA